MPGKMCSRSRTAEPVLASEAPSHHHLRGQWEPAGFGRNNGVPMPPAFGPPQTLKSDYLSLNADSATHFLALSIYSVSSPEIVYALPCRIIVKIEYFHAHEVSRPLLGILLLCYLSTPPSTHIPGILGPLQKAEVGPLSYLNLVVRQTQSHLQGTGVVVSGQACDLVFGGICGAYRDRSLNLA